jgi:transcriptional regulator with XRE-family HTH domain
MIVKKKIDPDSDYAKAIGRYLQRIRKTQDLNQTTLAPLLGLDQSALSRVESGYQQLTAVQLFVFCDTLQVKVGNLQRVIQRVTKAREQLKLAHTKIKAADLSD